MHVLSLTSALALACVALSPANAQSVADFYRGKTVDVYIGTSVGGGYDAYARLVSRYLGKYLPGNPNVVPQNMPGGGGMRLANFLFNAAPKEGTTIGIINRGIGFDQLLGNKTAQFEATRFNWIGSTNNEVSVCVAWHTVGVTRYEQVLDRELVVGASGPAADTFQFPKIANGVLGTKFKIIPGYPGGNDIDLAMERGEVQGRCGWSWTAVKATHQPWLDQKKIHILFQMALDKHPDLPNTPLIIDLARNDEDRAVFKLMFSRQVMAWPFVAPPGVPRERIEALRTAFTAAMQDKDFLADANKGNLEVRPVTGADMQKLINDVAQTQPALMQRTTQLLAQ
jgi:tripartite-type tricarboxylate transporter receptor subunit TctC